jgi:PleD family two-component response regulator
MAIHRLLLIEDDYDVAEMLLMYFSAHQYEVYHADSGTSGVDMARSKFPNVILLDVMLPDMDGYDVCAKLRQMSLTKYIPTIFLTQRDERASKVKGLELGADDYIVKPFDIDELRLRVQGSIRRATRESLHESRTGLPTGPMVDEELHRRQNGGSFWAAIQLGVDGFKAYGEVYGFMAADEVYGFAARAIQEVIGQMGTLDDFVGITEDRFIVLTHTSSPTDLTVAIEQKFSEGVKVFYSFKDTEQGGMILQPGTDQEEFVPLMRLTSLQAPV